MDEDGRPPLHTACRLAGMPRMPSSDLSTACDASLQMQGKAPQRSCPGDFALALVRRCRAARTPVRSEATVNRV